MILRLLAVLTLTTAALTTPAPAAEAGAAEPGTGDGVVRLRLTTEDGAARAADAEGSGLAHRTAQVRTPRVRAGDVRAGEPRAAGPRPENHRGASPGAPPPPSAEVFNLTD